MQLQLHYFECAILAILIFFAGFLIGRLSISRVDNSSRTMEVQTGNGSSVVQIQGDVALIIMRHVAGNDDPRTRLLEDDKS